MFDILVDFYLLYFFGGGQDFGSAISLRYCNTCDGLALNCAKETMEIPVF